jgi:A/G-specific adenine glycosylase
LNWQAIHRAVLAWFAQSARDLPWRRTRDPYAILVAELMLQQTQVDRVVPKYSSFLAQFPSFAALSAAPAADVIRAWQGLGYNRRAVRLQRIAQAVCTRYAGKLPDTIDGLAALEGVGRYTAAAVACFAFGRQEPVLDTNVRRVLGRIAYGPQGPRVGGPAAQWALAAQALPEGSAYAWNQALMDLGASVCTERGPKCFLCPVAPWCRAAGRVVPMLRERKARYDTAGAAPYAGSSRYYRGRIVERLRRLADGEALSPRDLGAAIRPDYAAEDAAWLDDLLRGLERDGLVARRADGSVCLP